VRGARAINTKFAYHRVPPPPGTIIVVVMCNVFLLRACTYNTDAVTEKHSFRGRGGRPNRENPLFETIIQMRTCIISPANNIVIYFIIISRYNIWGARVAHYNNI